MFSSSLFSSSRVFSIRFSWKLSFTLFKRYTLSSFNCTIIYFFVTPTSINYNSSIPYIFWTLSSRSEFVLYLDNYVIWSFVIVSLSTSLSGQQVNSCDWRWQTLWSGSQTVNPLGMSTGIWRAEDWSQWTSSQGSGRSVWVKLGANSWRSLSCGWQGNNPRLHMGQSSWREGWKQAPRGGYMLWDSYGHITPRRRTGGFSSLMRGTHSTRRTGRPRFDPSGTIVPVARSLNLNVTGTGTY